VVVSSGTFDRLFLWRCCWSSAGCCLAVAIVEQQVWGYAAIRRARLSGKALVITILLNFGIGVVIVALKVMISH
jgi:hypothetical protein